MLTIGTLLIYFQTHRNDKTFLQSSPFTIPTSKYCAFSSHRQRFFTTQLLLYPAIKIKTLFSTLSATYSVLFTLEFARDCMQNAATGRNVTDLQRSLYFFLYPGTKCTLSPVQYAYFMFTLEIATDIAVYCILIV